MREVKVVIGANYGDEGKGLVTRYFCKDALVHQRNPVVILHNGTAQRGHTVDYTPTKRCVFHHFGSGTGDYVPTYFAKTYLIHPMEFHREAVELTKSGFPIRFFCYCDPEAKVITPFDMLVDHVTEEHIHRLHGEPEFGSCGYGSWCAAEDRIPYYPDCAYTIKDFCDIIKVPSLLEDIYNRCMLILERRGVDFERSSYAGIAKNKSVIIHNFTEDIKFFLSHTYLVPFDKFWDWDRFNTFIFENGQGLGLDCNIGNEWHTTSNTGLLNPSIMLQDKKDYIGEACYVSRTYLTRHGVGPLENECEKRTIDKGMFDRTNIFNDFQGGLRYGMIDYHKQKIRIDEDFARAEPSVTDKFIKTVCYTHTNELPDLGLYRVDYYSNNPYEVKKNEC